MNTIINSVIAISTLVGALGVLLASLKKMHKFINIQEDVIYDIQKMKQEQKLVYTGLCACLDGLEQLGCNHSVPKAKAELEEWINEQAHE